jgi:hypothetical protein
MGVIPKKKCIEIPQHYLKEVNQTEGKKYIEVLFGKDSVEHLRIGDDKTRTEIFEYLKENIPSSKFYIDKYSKLRAGRKPMIAMAVIVAFFCWSYHLASGIESGDEYGVTGDNFRSVAGIALMLAWLGTTKLLLIFSLLLSIAIIAFIQKTKHPKVVHKIQVVR